MATFGAPHAVHPGWAPDRQDGIFPKQSGARVTALSAQA